MHYASKTSVFFASIFIFACGFFAPVPTLAATVNSLFPVNLPHALPWNDGTTVWTKWIAWRTASNTWELVYHNSDIDVDSGGYITASPWLDSNHAIFTAGNNATSWSLSTSNHLTSAPGMFFDTMLQAAGGAPCKEKLYASNTIFSVGNRDVAAYCTDIIPYEFGDPIFDRINLQADHYTFQTQTTDPAPPTVLNPDTSEYVDVPSPVTDPAGFVDALLTNLGIWFYNLVLPSNEYFSTQFDTLQSNIATAFPWAIQLSDAFNSFVSALTSSTPSSITLNGLNVGGNTGNYTVFNPANLPDMTNVKTFLSVMMYVGTGWWLIRRTNSLFRA